MRRRAAEVAARGGPLRRASTDPRAPGPRPRPGRVVAFVVGLVTVPVAAGIVLLGAGAQVPAPGPVLLLAMVATLAVNRSVFFPSEQAATAEVAIVLAAVTGFADTSPWLGPLVVALLVGPLDVSHWESRSFVRMAYNAGNRGAAALAATGAFAAIGAHAGVAPAALAAAAAFVVVDLAVSTTLLLAQGTPARLALAGVASVDRFGLPLAVSGATIGFVVDGFGWWMAALALVPLAFVPELLIVARARGTGSRRAWRAGGILGAGAIASGAWWLLLPSSTLASSAALLTIGVLLGVELDADPDGRPSPLVVVVVVAAAVVVPRDGAYLLAPLAAMATCAATWWCATPRPPPRRVCVTGVVVIGGSLGIVAAASAVGTPLGSVFGALVAAVAVTFVLVALERHGASVAAFGWSLPFVGVAAAIAGVWRVIGPSGVLVFVAWAGATAVVARSFGATPWRVRPSVPATRPVLRARRRVGHRARHDILHSARHRVGLVVAAGAAGALAVVSIVSTARGVRTTAGWLSVAVIESMAVIVLVGIRQWRLAPRARTRAAVLAGASALAGVATGDALAKGLGWASVALGVAAVTLVGTGWRPARCVDAVRPTAPTGRRR